MGNQRVTFCWVCFILFWGSDTFSGRELSTDDGSLIEKTRKQNVSYFLQCIIQHISCLSRFKTYFWSFTWPYAHPLRSRLAATIPIPLSTLPCFRHMTAIALYQHIFTSCIWVGLPCEHSQRESLPPGWFEGTGTKQKAKSYFVVFYLNQNDDYRSRKCGLLHGVLWFGGVKHASVF